MQRSGCKLSSFFHILAEKQVLIRDNMYQIDVAHPELKNLQPSFIKIIYLYFNGTKTEL